MPRVLNSKARNKNVDPFVYIGRPGKWVAPFVLHQDGDRDEVIKKFEEWFLSQPKLIDEARRELKGKNLMCWCAPLACHGDVILRVVNDGS